MLSVIIPNYNHAAFLVQRIESVLHQTWQDFEVIILDDCSTDSSREIIESYRKYPKVSQIVYNDVNSGSTFLQWEKGIQLAKGSWIWIAESDDFADPELLAQLTASIDKNEKLVLSYCQSYEVDENNHVTRTMEYWTHDVDPLHWTTDYISNGTDEIARYLVHKNTIPNASAVIFKKSAYYRIGKSFTSMRYCGDWLLWIKLLSVGEVSFVSKPLNYLRKHQATTRTMSSAEKLRKRLEEEYEMLLFIQKEVGIGRQDFNKKQRWILYLYKNSMTRKQLLTAFIPFKYKGRIPFYKVFLNILSSIFSRQRPATNY